MPRRGLGDPPPQEFASGISNPLLPPFHFDSFDTWLNAKDTAGNSGPDDISVLPTWAIRYSVEFPTITPLGNGPSNLQSFMTWYHH